MNFLVLPSSTPPINHLDRNLLLRDGFEETLNQVKLELTQRLHRGFLVCLQRSCTVWFWGLRLNTPPRKWQPVWS